MERDSVVEVIDERIAPMFKENEASQLCVEGKKALDMRGLVIPAFAGTTKKRYLPNMPALSEPCAGLSDNQIPNKAFLNSNPSMTPISSPFLDT